MKIDSFVFTFMGSDEYHQNTFIYKHDSDIHEAYWCFGNMCPGTKFTRQLTIVTSQMPPEIPLHIMHKLIYKQWIHLL